MLELSDKNMVIGLKHSKRALEEGRAACVFIAMDADEHIKDGILRICKETDIPVVFADTMKELGESCQIDVGCAVAAELR